MTPSVNRSSNDNDDRSDRTPWQCKKQACAYQYCISKNSSYRPDAVQFCRHPYYTSYLECMEQMKRSDHTKESSL